MWSGRVTLPQSFIGESRYPFHFHYLVLTMVLLVTSDNEQFIVEKDVAERSVLIKNMLEGIYFPLYPTRPTLKHDPIDVGESDQPIPLPNVSSSVLKKVITLDVMISYSYRFLAHRSLNTANITGESDSQPQTPSHKMRLASAPPTSANGTRSSSQSTKRCFLRSSWLRIISISSHSCQCL